MSEKITFGELIESIAAETDHSKQFTHDFLKDFVDVINGGLEEDGKVNIAGFGKFNLKRVDEREGYNPQTEEKMTIPAHNKIVFKPYKDLRELVNAPYAHMESKLLEETSVTSDSQEDKAKDSKQSIDANNDQSADDSSTEKEQVENDFIPTAPPTSHDEEVLDDTENGDDDPFNLDSKDSTESPETKNDTGDDSGDIVEFEANTSKDEDDSGKDILEQFIGASEEESLEDSESQTTADDTGSQEQESSTTDSEKEILEEEVAKLEETAEELKQQSDQADDDQEPTDKEKQDEEGLPAVGMQQSGTRSSAFPYVAAALVLLLLIVGGVWYYSNISDSNMPVLSSKQTTASTEVADAANSNDQQETTGDEQSEEAQQAEAENQSSASNNTASTQQAAPPTSQTGQSEASVEIEEGQTLWSLAEERYGNPRLWPWIYGYDGSVEDPDVIYAGSSLSVPLPSGPQNSLNAADSVGVAKGFLATYKWYKSNEEAVAKNHLWAAKSYHNNLQQIADIPIDKTDLSFANSAR